MKLRTGVWGDGTSPKGFINIYCDELQLAIAVNVEQTIAETMVERWNSFESDAIPTPMTLDVFEAQVKKATSEYSGVLKDICHRAELARLDPKVCLAIITAQADE